MMRFEHENEHWQWGNADVHTHHKYLFIIRRVSIAFYFFSLFCEFYLLGFLQIFLFSFVCWVFTLRYDDIHRHSKIYYGMLALATAQTSIQFSSIQFNASGSYVLCFYVSVHLCMCAAFGSMLFSAFFLSAFYFSLVFASLSFARHFAGRCFCVSLQPTH